jgi:hypothetical protein
MIITLTEALPFDAAAARRLGLVAFDVSFPGARVSIVSIVSIVS